MRIHHFHLACASVLMATMIGCASIVGNPLHTMPISSVPSDADILIKDESGAEFFKGKTPTTVSLPKSTGKYFGKKSYTVTISKEGFEDQSVTVTASANGWYVGGNFVFGGLIGWLIVDPQNGKMYNMSPENISSTLKAKVLTSSSSAQSSLPIVSLVNIPVELRDKLSPVSTQL